MIVADNIEKVLRQTVQIRILTVNKIKEVLIYFVRGF